MSAYVNSPYYSNTVAGSPASACSRLIVDGRMTSSQARRYTLHSGACDPKNPIAGIVLPLKGVFSPPVFWR